MTSHRSSRAWVEYAFLCLLPCCLGPSPGLLLPSMHYFWIPFPPISCFYLARIHLSNAFLGQCAYRMDFPRLLCMLEHVCFFLDDGKQAVWRFPVENDSLSRVRRQHLVFSAVQSCDCLVRESLYSPPETLGSFYLGTLNFHDVV